MLSASAILIALAVGAVLGYQHAGFVPVLLTGVVVAAVSLWRNWRLVGQAREMSWGRGAPVTMAARLTVVLIYVSMIPMALALAGATYWIAVLLRQLSR